LETSCDAERKRERERDGERERLRLRRRRRRRRKNDFCFMLTFPTHFCSLLFLFEYLNIDSNLRSDF